MDIVYYAACSLDGYIATEDGGVDWLMPFQESGDHGFKEFYSSVDAIVMGSHTYEFALQHPWLAADKPSWVFTSRNLEIAHPSVTLISQEPTRVAALIKGRGLNRVWLMGGGKLAASFREFGLITHYMIAMVPVLLGKGIPLFADGSKLDRLELIESRQFPSGIVQLNYEFEIPP